THWPHDDGVGPGGPQPDADDTLASGLLEHDGSDLGTAEPGAPAHVRSGALDEPIGFTEVEEELDAAVREGALAAMRAGAVVRPDVVDQSLQLRRPPHAVAPGPERRNAPGHLEPG